MLTNLAAVITTLSGCTGSARLSTAAGSNPRLVNIHVAQHHSKKAAACSNRCINEMRERDPLELAKCLLHTGIVNFRLGDNGAQSRFQESLTIKELELGKGSGLLEIDLVRLASLCIAQEKYDESEKLLRRAQSTQLRQSDCDPDILRILDDLAITYIARHEYDKAGPLVERALQIREQSGAGADAEQADTLEDLCHYFRLLGEKGDSILLRAGALIKRYRDVDQTF